MTITNTATFIPSICTDVRLKTELRDMFLDTWTRFPLPERRQVPSQPSVQHDALKSGSSCIVAFENMDSVLLAIDGSPHIAWEHAPSEFAGFADRPAFLLCIETINPSTVAHLQSGEVIHVSMSHGEDHCWATLVFACLMQELQLEPEQLRSVLEAAGLSFTGDYVNEVNRWLRCRVLAVVQRNDFIEVLTEIEAITLNNPWPEAYPNTDH